MRYTLTAVLIFLAYGSAADEPNLQDAGRQSGSAAPQGELQIEIQTSPDELQLLNGKTSIEIEGVASTIGGVKYLDMIFVMDTSMSLQQTDPDDFRSGGAIGLVDNLSPRSDTKIGVVSFDKKGHLAQPMTADRGKVVDALRKLNRSGSTNIAAGIHTALEELEKNGRPGSSRMIMLFTDGKSNRKKAEAAALQAQIEGVAVQALLLGSSKKGAAILDNIAWATGGSFVQVSDPAMLPEAFLNLRTTGVDSVTLSVNGSAPFPAQLTGGTFTGNLPLEVGENRIVALATSLDNRTQAAVMTVNVQDASCAALDVAAVSNGRPVLSLDDKAVEIVVDASRSMWGRMDGEPKMAVAQEILHDVSNWIPDDLELALRAYGSTSPSDDNNCGDSALLVPFGDNNREPIQRAVADLRPKGQTPIAYALKQAAQDFGPGQSDRTVVLVTDGIESCGGDPVEAARALYADGITVHLIGFGLGNAKDEDAASLQAVADAAGGRYITAGSAEELKEALAHTVATPYRVFKGNIPVASGSLGSDEPVFLPGGDYRVELESSPPRELPVTLAARDQLTLTLEKQDGLVSHFEQRGEMPYTSCDEVVAAIEQLEEQEARRSSLATTEL